jgi:CRISPR-associated protein Csh2
MKRSEILFLYDSTWANPNGDPTDDNKPRIDEKTKLNYVTDVRLKRTIRDYVYNNYRQAKEDSNNSNEFKNDIFIIENTKEDDFLVNTLEERLENITNKIEVEFPKPKKKGKNKEIQNDEGKKENTEKSVDYNRRVAAFKKELLNNFFDIRCFGATVALEGYKISLTGPVQFLIGESLHPVTLVHIQGSGAFASDAKRNKNKTIREEYKLPYSLIAFYGIINENAAIHTQLQDKDVEFLMKAMWYGTRDLITRSKFSQNPRMLIRIEYNDNTGQIGELNRLISLENTGNLFEEYRSIKDFSVNVTNLISKIKDNKEYIDKVYLAYDSNLNITITDANVSTFKKDIESILGNEKVEDLLKNKEKK